MFSVIKSFWSGVKSMFSVTDIQKIVGSRVELSEVMIDNLELWRSMFSGDSPWEKDAPSLGIELGICREFADICINEMDASVEDEHLNDLFQHAIRDLNENLQDGLALGSMIIKPMMGGGIEYISADNFIPITFDSGGKVQDCIFIQRKRESEYRYLFRTERHTRLPGGLRIENRAWQSHQASAIGTQTALSVVPEWADLPEEIFYPGMTDNAFGYYRNPVKNRIDNSYCGVSVYSGKAVNLIRKADIQGARIDWEFESGERAIHVDERALKHNKRSGTISVAKGKERLYRGLNVEPDKGELFKEYSPDFRQSGLIDGLESYFRQIEFAVGLAYGDLSNVQNVDKTATEIKAAKQRKYNRVSAIQVNLKDCLEDLVKAIAFYDASYTKNHELICTFNDSILTDEEAERTQDRNDVSMSVMSLEEYRAKWYGEDIDTARENLPASAEPVLDNLSVKESQKPQQSAAAEVQGKSLNGAQTQSLISIMAQFTAGSISEGQAINLISTAIGVSKEEARAILNGEL